MAKKKITAKVTNCARCECNHRKVVFRKFKKQQPPKYTHWGTCPKTKEPILMFITSED